jgi:hypothetical protein
MNSYLTVPIDSQTVFELTAIARQKNMTVEQLAAELIDEYLENAELLAIAMKSLNDDEPTIPWEDVQRRLVR